MKNPSFFSIPSEHDMEIFFRKRFSRNFSSEEKKVATFFHYRLENTLNDNMETNRIHLAATIILMISPEERRNYCLSNNTFGGNEKRSGFAQLIGAIFLKNQETLNHLIEESNQKSSRIFSSVSLDQDSSTMMQQFCTDYAISLAKKIYDLFNHEERNTWDNASLPLPHTLINYQQKDQLRILGHSEQKINELTLMQNQTINNPYGYSLRSLTENKKTRL